MPWTKPEIYHNHKDIRASMVFFCLFEKYVHLERSGANLLYYNIKYGSHAAPDERKCIWKPVFMWGKCNEGNHLIKLNLLIWKNVEYCSERQFHRLKEKINKKIIFSYW